MTTKSFRHPWGRVTTCRVYDHSPGAIHDEAFRFEGDWRTLACRPMHWCFSSRSDRPGFRGSQLVKWCALTRHAGAAVTLRATGPSLRLGIISCHVKPHAVLDPLAVQRFNSRQAIVQRNMANARDRGSSPD